jgi:hypothetical protein
MSFAEELSKLDAEEDMPLVWPVLSPAERQLVAPPHRSSTQLVLAVATGTTALFAIVASAIFKLSGAQPAPRRDRSGGDRLASAMGHRRQSASPPSQTSGRARGAGPRMDAPAKPAMPWDRQQPNLASFHPDYRWKATRAA